MLIELIHVHTFNVVFYRLSTFKMSNNTFVKTWEKLPPLPPLLNWVNFEYWTVNFKFGSLRTLMFVGYFQEICIRWLKKVKGSKTKQHNIFKMCVSYVKNCILLSFVFSEQSTTSPVLYRSQQKKKKKKKKEMYIVFNMWADDFSKVEGFCCSGRSFMGNIV